MRESIKTLRPYLNRHRSGFALGLGALVVKVMLTASQPLLIRSGIDSLSSGFNLTLLLTVAGGLVGISAVKGVFQYWMRIILVGISRDVEYDIRNDLFTHLTDLSGDYYRKMRTGDIMARATNDLNAVRMMVGPGVMYWCETFTTFVLAVAVMLSVDWPLTLLALIPAPAVSVAVVYFGRQIHVRFEKIQGMFSDISSRVQENLAGVRVVRSYAQEDAELRQFEKLNRDYIGEILRLARISGVFMPVLQALIGITFLIVLWAGGIRLLKGEITLGSFVMFNTYMGMLIWPMIAMGWVVNLMQRGSASLKRINEMLEERPTIAAPASPRRLENVKGEIEFRDVLVTYPGGQGLNKLNLVIPAGQTIAIVGHTGSGKSTLVQLIPRLMDPTAGEVLLDGVGLREYDPCELRRHIGMVPQESYLFSMTLRENITFGARDAGGETTARAVAIAGLDSDVAGFPDGLDTVVGERGITLSGGQKQRTAIARAILRDPRILILDDALSSVDTMTEEKILRELTEVMRQRTTILISHRVSTVRHADRIFVLENGSIAEQGSHAELLALNGYYADLYQKQMLEEELEAI